MARLLVIDDDIDLRIALARGLSDQHDVVATTARDALALITGGARFDLLLCDLKMPDMTGLQLHGALAETAPDQASRMVFMSGCTATDPARVVLARLPNAQIEKPFDATTLKRLVDSLI